MSTPLNPLVVARLREYWRRESIGATYVSLEETIM